MAAAVGYLPFTVFKFPQTQKAHRFRIDSGFCVLFTCRRQAVSAWLPGGGHFQKVFLRRKLENEKAASGAIL